MNCPPATVARRLLASTPLSPRVFHVPSRREFLLLEALCQWFLLRDAVDIAASIRKLTRRQLQNLVLRKNLAQYAACGFVAAPIAKRGHHNSTVGDIEIDIRLRQSQLALVSYCRLLQRNDFELSTARVGGFAQDA